jgi:hypothetical protein
MPTSPQFRVDFVIGGTQKGGTSALAKFLGSHPEICLPIKKEVHLFDAPDFPVPAGPEEINVRYRKAFSEELTGHIVGDATPIYMYLPWVAPRIREYNPAMKWILLLRDPVERAISHYSMERARGAERLPLGTALHLEGLRLWRDRSSIGWASSRRVHSYLDRGYYSRQIGNLWQSFPRAQTLVLTSEQLRTQHRATLELVYTFLGAQDWNVLPEAEDVFATAEKPPVSPALRAWMRRRFEPEIRRLEDMLGRSFGEWNCASGYESR